LLRAGETEQALDKFLAHAIASRALTDRNFEAFHQQLLALPSDWYETYEEVLRLVRELQRPKSDEFALLLRLSGFAAVAGVGHAQVLRLTMQLKQASGLSDWEQLDPTLDPGARLKRAFEQAHARYAASPEFERFADPGTAIRELANAVRMAMSISALTMDLEAALAVPSLQPLLMIAPPLFIVDQLVRGVQARLSGRVERARETYRALIERLTTPEKTGLELTHLEYARLMVMNGMAVLDAASGLAGCLEAADLIAKNPTLQSNAWLIRMVHYLWQGDSYEAERCRKQFDVSRVQSSAAQNFESVQLTWQLIAHVAMEDLTRIKRSLAEVAPMAAKFPAFRTVLAYGEAEYQRIRGDSASAVASLSSVLRTCEAGSHQVWPQLAAAHVHALDDAGQREQAVETGRRYLADAARADMGASATYWITLALCVVEAKLGQIEAARTAETLIEQCLAAGATGLKLGLAYEARARIAVLQSDANGCDRYRALCKQEFAKASNPALSAKLQKLKRDAQQRHLASQAPVLHNTQVSVVAGIKTRLRAGDDAPSRARDVLQLLAECSGASEGYLFQIREGQPIWTAAIGAPAPDDALQALVRDYVMAELHAGEESTDATQIAVQTDWTRVGEHSYRPVLLSHYGPSGHVITGVAVFIVSDDRQFVYPGEAATEISQFIHDIGDVTGLVVVGD
jgi:hypothetical protein